MEDDNNPQLVNQDVQPQVPGQSIQPNGTPQPTMQPPQVTSNSMPPNKSKKKLIVLIIFVILVIGAGIGYALLMADGENGSDANVDSQSESQQEEQTQPQLVEKEVIELATTKQLYAENEEGNLEAQLDLAENEEYLFSSQDGLTHFFQVTGGQYDAAQSFWMLRDGEKTELIEKVVNDQSLTLIEVSPNGKEIAVFIEGNIESNYGEFAVGTLDVELRQLTVWDDSELLYPVGWLDDDTLVFSHPACWNCDGGWLPEVWMMEREDEAATKIADFASRNESFAGSGIVVDQNARIIYTMVADNFSLGIDVNQVNKSTTEIHVIDPDADLVKLLYKTTGVYARMFNLSSNGASVIITTQKAVKPANLQTPEVALVNVSTGKASKIPVSLSLLDQQDYPGFDQIAYSDENEVLYMALSDYGDTSNRAVVYSLDISGGESSVETLFDEQFSDDEYLSNMWLKTIMVESE